MLINNYLLGVYIGGGLTVLLLVAFGTLALIYFLARRNILFTIVEEGTAKAILKFSKFHKIVMAYEGYSIDQKGIIRLIEEGGQKRTELPKRPREEVKKGEEYEVELQKQPPPWMGGLRWVGIPFLYSVRSYNFRWTSVEQKVAEEGERKGKLVSDIIHKGEPIDYILLRDDIYLTFIREAETGTETVDETKKVSKKKGT